MSRMAAIVTSMALLAAPMPASAKEKVDSRIKTAIGCASVTPNEERLRCYDQAIGGLKLALESGQLIPADESRTPKALAGVVTAAGPMGFNRFWVELDTGDRWELIADSSNDVAPRRGAKIKLRKGIMGNYWFVDPASVDRMARFLGRRS
jgi:hypothetical protein